jgi:hypothetical protein
MMKNMLLNCRCAGVLLSGMLLLGGCVTNLPSQQAATPDNGASDSSFVVLGENALPVARVITSVASCPSLRVDGIDMAMTQRAAPTVLPLRSTRSSAAETKPSAFPLLTCEKALPPGAKQVSVNGRNLPLPAAEIRRIVVIGDTGCRIKTADNAAQACNDAQQYPFASIAATAARWHPDLVVHVGDYLYRENPCPAGNRNCAGSPWGYGWDAWNADFFKPAAPLLQAAPWVMVRGNHESCTRAGQGWWRMLDPRPLLPGRDCVKDSDDEIGDYSDPYAVPIGGSAQFIVLDTSNTGNGAPKADDSRARQYADLYRKMDSLSQQAAYNIGVNHHPVLGVSAKEKAGQISVSPGNKGLQAVFSQFNPQFFPSGIDLMLSGHVHVWEQLSFSSAHPSQFVAGFSGTAEDIVPLPASLPAGMEPAPGAIVAHFSSWVNGFGYMTMERTGAAQWDVKIWNVAGQQVNSCHVDGKKSMCEQAQVNSAH